jgi:glycosyltransferase involved in cell wall biosynthesis
LARDLGKKIVWTMHDLESHDGADFLDRRGYRLLASRSDLCICHDESARQESIRLFGCDPERLLTMPHGNYDGAYPPAREREATLKTLGLDPGRPVLLCFGLARPYKGFDIAIAALQLLPTEYQLIVAGAVLDPEYGSSLQAQGKGDPRLRLLFRELSDQELADLLHASDCVLLPYRRITGSGVLFSALSMSRGVVATDLPYFRSTLAEDPDAGVLCRKGDVADLAAAVQRFFAQPLAVRQSAARHLADGRAWDRVVRPFGEWLQQALPERVQATRQEHPVSAVSNE